MLKKQNAAANRQRHAGRSKKGKYGVTWAIVTGIALAGALHLGLSSLDTDHLRAKWQGVTEPVAETENFAATQVAPRAKPILQQRSAHHPASRALPDATISSVPETVGMRQDKGTTESLADDIRPAQIATDAQITAALRTLGTELALKHLTRHLQAQAILSAQEKPSALTNRPETDTPGPVVTALDLTEAPAQAAGHPPSVDTARARQNLPSIGSPASESLTVASISPATPPVPQLRPRPLVRTPVTQPQLAYAATGDPSSERGRYGGFGKLLNGRTGLPGPAAKIAVYDISSATVHMPDGTKLRAHSGIGHRMDNPKYAYVKNLGPTPPNVYKLRMRERRFHGVEAIRMLPVDRAAMKGRDGMLAHSPLLRRSKGSHGCVAFQDYNTFLRAFKKGKVKTMIVVPSMEKLPTYMAKLKGSAPG